MQTNILSNGERQYTMFDLMPQNNDIWYWENVISSPNELVGFIEELDSIVESYPRISQWKNWTASDDQSMIYGLVKDMVSDLKTVDIANNRIEQKTRYVINSLKMAVEMCSDKYVEARNLPKEKYKLDTDTIKVRKWNTGQSMGPHADGQDGNYGLAFTIVMYLNDNYEGGEIVFPDHNISIKPKAGSLVMFPATSNFVHKVMPITSGNRYSSSCSLLVV
jgi:hypothetical protein